MRGVLAAMLLATLASTAFATTWDAASDYSIANNPNGVWSYGRKFGPSDSAFNLMTVRWGDAGWYMGNVGHGGPSISGGEGLAPEDRLPHLWAKDNSNGLPVLRWTSPQDGLFRIVGTFGPGDARGVNNRVYVAINDVIVLSGTIDSPPQAVPFDIAGSAMRAGDTVDFVTEWTGVGNSELGWMQVRAVISTEAATCADSDGDGETDGTDACPETPAGAAVDSAGCSQAQFCAALDATIRKGARGCRASDWRNDEPVGNPKDCTVDKATRGRTDDRCVPTVGGRVTKP